VSIVGVGLIVLDAKENLDGGADVFDQLRCGHQRKVVALLHELGVRQFLDLQKGLLRKVKTLTSAGDLTLTSRKRNSSRFLTSFDASMWPPSLRWVLFVSTKYSSAVFLCKSSSVMMTIDVFDISSWAGPPSWTVIDSSILGTLYRSPTFFS